VKQKKRMKGFSKFSKLKGPKYTPPTRLVPLKPLPKYDSHSRKEFLQYRYMSRMLNSNAPVLLIVNTTAAKEIIKPVRAKYKLGTEFLLTSTLRLIFPWAVGNIFAVYWKGTKLLPFMKATFPLVSPDFQIVCYIQKGHVYFPNHVKLLLDAKWPPVTPIMAPLSNILQLLFARFSPLRFVALVLRGKLPTEENGKEENETKENGEEEKKEVEAKEE